MNKIFPLLLLPFLLWSCTDKTVESPKEDPLTYNELDTNFTSLELITALPHEILFQKKDMVEVTESLSQTIGETSIPAKGKFDFMAYLPIEGSSEHGWVWVNHETRTDDPKGGNGGGASMLEVQMKDGKWETLGKYHVDFSPVGGTLANCLGAVTSYGTIITSEEDEPANNLYLVEKCDMTDTSDIGGYPRYMNFGWMVEVDPVTRTAKRKLYDMGRFMHEGNYSMKDGKTVYMMDDETPGAFFKFVADVENDYGSGQLYAFKQSADGKSGEWLALPRGRENMNRARDLAFEMGATIFIRMEDVELLNNGKFLITETGLDETDFGPAIALGASPAAHHVNIPHEGNIYNDYYGRVLLFDPETNEVSVFLEAGLSPTDPGKHLANPDNMAYDPNTNRVVIHEDINGTDKGRVAAHSEGTLRSEVYLLDLNGEISIDALKRIAISPPKSETTGGIWSPDGKTLFFNVQHPSKNNPAPWDKDATVAIRGL